MPCLGSHDPDWLPLGSPSDPPQGSSSGLLFAPSCCGAGPAHSVVSLLCPFLYLLGTQVDQRGLPSLWGLQPPESPAGGLEKSGCRVSWPRTLCAVRHEGEFSCCYCARAKHCTQNDQGKDAACQELSRASGGLWLGGQWECSGEWTNGIWSLPPHFTGLLWQAGHRR